MSMSNLESTFDGWDGEVFSEFIVPSSDCLIGAGEIYAENMWNHQRDSHRSGALYDFEVAVMDQSKLIQ